jgi:hypothetical protein
VFWIVAGVPITPPETLIFTFLVLPSIALVTNGAPVMTVDWLEIVSLPID